MSSIAIGIIGISGKMGNRIAALAAHDSDIKTISGVSSKNFEKLQEFIGSTDVLIDFSNAACLPSLLSFAKEAKKPLVIGTTGHHAEELIAATAKEIPIFCSANFSLGIALLTQTIRHISKALPKDYAIEIEETHHVHKKDSPSGTALTLAAALPPERYPRLSSKREGDVIGEHAIIFIAQDEKLILHHSAISRDLFAKGALLAAKFIIGKPAGLYGMDHLIQQKTISL